MTGGAVGGGQVAGATRHVEFLEVLGRGGFGAVYLADVHGANGFVQRAAVKVLNNEMADMADIAARQRDEARLLARLQHHAIVRVFDLCELHGRPAVLMEYVEGVDCSVLLRGNGLPPRAALQVIATAASALDAAYNHPVDRGGTPLRVVHRDIKPANLLVSKHGGVKVLDFGVARGEFDREGRTESVQFGTARYMAPEQWLYGSVGHGVDLYALGVTLAELLAGQNLGRAPLQPEAFRDHVDAVIAKILRPEWSLEARTGIAHLLAGMLTHGPAERLDAASVQDLAQGLADELPGESLPRYARRRVPALIEARRLKMRQLPVLDATPVSYPGQPPTRRDSGAPVGPDAEAVSSSGTLAGLSDPPSSEVGAKRSDTLAHRAARLAALGALPAASLAETIPPPDDTSGHAVPPPPVVPPRAVPPPDATERLDDRFSTLARQGRRLRARGVGALSERVLLNDADVDSTACRPPDMAPPGPLFSEAAEAAEAAEGAGGTAASGVAAGAGAGATSPDLSFGPEDPALDPQVLAPVATVLPDGPAPETPALGGPAVPRAPVLPTLPPEGAPGRAAQPDAPHLPAAVASVPPPATDAVPASGPARRTGRGLVFAGLAVFALVGLAGLSGALWPAAESTATPPPAAAPPTADPVTRALAAETAPSAAPEPTEPAVALPETDRSSTRSVPSAPAPSRPENRPAQPTPTPTAPAAPAPQEAPPGSAPAPVAAVQTPAAPSAGSAPDPADPVLLDLRVTSIPLNAVVYIDGERVGNATPGVTFPVTPGPHVLRLELGEDAIEQTVPVSALRSNRFTWNRDKGTLQVHP